MNDADDGFDSDRDGLSDVEEEALGTNPSHPDTDGDGFTDGFELSAGLDPLVPNAEMQAPILSRTLGGLLDSDADGLPDVYEEEHGLNPRSADSDGDGIFDGAAVLNRYEATTPSGDADGDGLLDSAELKLGSDPTLIDTDLDGLIDPLEFLYSLDPRNPDTDGDGVLDGIQTGNRSFRYVNRSFHVEE